MLGDHGIPSGANLGEQGYFLCLTNASMAPRAWPSGDCSSETLSRALALDGTYPDTGLPQACGSPVSMTPGSLS